MQGDQALVPGGGGVAGIAWITGLLARLAVAGQVVTSPQDMPRRADAYALAADTRIPAAEAGLAQGRGGLVDAG